MERQAEVQSKKRTVAWGAWADHKRVLIFVVAHKKVRIFEERPKDLM